MTLQKSWVASANAADADFPLNNLPYGVFSKGGSEPRPCVAIGDQVVDLSVLEENGVISAGDGPVFDVPYINEFMELGPEIWSSVRARLMDLLGEGADEAALKGAMHGMGDVEMHMPFVVSEYTDFYAGKHHATNVGTMFRGAENALPPNWLHIPIGYNGRASTVVVSGTDVRRPMGQLKPPTADVPHFGPCKRLDIELEMGAVVGFGNEMGEPISTVEADEMIFGYVLLNDWSARDIQAWEYQPLGPFQAKVFATSISPWVVTKEALEPFRVATPAREVPLLPYLEEEKPGLYDISLEVWMEPEGGARARIAATNYDQMYYSSAQQLAHHASGGCEMNCGDLLGSGTISGPSKEERGSLLELSWGGKEPIDVGGVERSFLEDGDAVSLVGYAQGDGYRVGFGSCDGRIVSSVEK